jgi:hypothetical protein
MTIAGKKKQTRRAFFSELMGHPYRECFAVLLHILHDVPFYQPI